MIIFNRRSTKFDKHSILTVRKISDYWAGEWGTLRYANNAAFLALVLAKSGPNNLEYATQYVKWARKQIWYTLGDNPDQRSYLIGYGNNYPKFINHKVAVCPLEYDMSCGCPGLYHPEKNRRDIPGAIVGGPNFNDRYVDQRNNFIFNEVRLDYQASFSGSVSALAELTQNNLRSDIIVETVWK